MARGNGTRAAEAVGPLARPGGLEALERRTLLTATVASLVRDLVPGDLGSAPGRAVSMAGGLAFYASQDTSNGTTVHGIHRTDGTAAGSARLATYLQAPQNLTVSGNYAYYSGQGVFAPRQVYRTDGTPAGTVQLTNFTYTSTTTRSYTDVNGTLYFATTGRVGTTNTQELWRSTGTAAATAPVTPALKFKDVGAMVNLNGTLYFAASETDGARLDLWKSDGTDAGTVRVATLPYAATSPHAEPQTMTVAGGTLYFYGDDGAGGKALWKSDGTAAGTVMVKSLAPVGSGALLGAIVGAAGKVFFVISGGSTRWRLIVSDGTAAGTGEFVDLYPGGNAGYQWLSNFNGQLYFSAASGIGSSGLYRTDGTATGTHRVDPGAGNHIAMRNTVMGGTMYFVSTDATAGQELWRTDGTTMTRLADVRPGPEGSAPTDLVVLRGTPAGDRLLFRANDGAHGPEMWISDGTAAGTTLLTNFVSAPQSGNPTLITPAGNRTFFNANGQLWVSDGRGANSVPLSSAQIEPYTSAPAYAATAALGNVLFYRSAGKLYRSDGTAAGTARVSDVLTNVHSLLAFDGAVYFAATDPVNKRELWRTDGTSAGTVRVTTGDVQPHQLVDMGGYFAFLGQGKLWRSDGTTAGTVAVTPGQVPSVAQLTFFQRAGGYLFYATPGSLWRSDGTIAGTVDVVDSRWYVGQHSRVRELGGNFYFIGAEVDSTSQKSTPGLYVTDGTYAGTSRVKVLASPITYGQESGYDLQVMGGNLYFIGPEKGSLWRSDGTAAGTVPVASVSSAASLTVAGSALYFTVGGGGALYTTDGVAAPVRVQGPGGVTLSTPTGLTTMDGALVFGAAGPADVGTELWLAEPGVTPGAPAAPGPLNAAAANGGQIDLSWLDLAAGESGYRLERSLTAAFATIDRTIVLPPDTTAFADSTALPNTTYHYRLVATTRGGDSATVTTTAGGVATPVSPARPTNVSAVAESDTKVTLTWKDVATTETGYVVDRLSEAGAVEATFTLPAGTTSLVDTGTVALRKYTYRVRALGTDQPSGYATTTVTLPDRAPTNVFVAAATSTKVDIYWTNPGTTVTGYRIHRSVNGGAWTQIGTALATATQYTDTNAKPTLAHVYRVIADNASGGSYGAPTTPVYPPAPVLTAIVKPLPDVPVPADNAFPGRPLVVGGIAFFTANSATSLREIWRSDGTAAGTFNLAPTLRPMSEPVASGGVAYFFASATGILGTGLYRSDGTVAGTVRLATVSPNRDAATNPLTPLNGKVYFRGPSTAGVEPLDAIWESDGTAAGTKVAVTLGRLVNSNGLRPMAVVGAGGAGGKLILGGNRPGDWALVVFVSDGTQAGTFELIPTTGPRPTQVQNVIPGATVSYFYAREESNPAAPMNRWFRTDGTPAGTWAITDPGQMADSNAYVVGDTLYDALRPHVGGTGTELYRANATATQFELVVDANPGAGDSVVSAPARIAAGDLFVAASGGVAKLYLIPAGGGPATVVASFAAVDGSFVADTAAIGGRAYFFVRDPADGWGLYASDGTAAGTVLVRRYPGTQTPGAFATLNGRLTFAADDAWHGLELWQTDGTPAGTDLVKDVAANPVPSRPDSFVLYKGKAYFTFGAASGGTPGTARSGGAIYRTDGTTAGTELVWNGVAGDLFLVGDWLYFRGTDRETGAEIWRTDGTAAGTHRVTDLAPGRGNIAPRFLAAAGTRLVFALPDPTAAGVYHLWSTDGTAAGTVPLGASTHAPTGQSIPLTVRDGVVYFGHTPSATTTRRLWRTDGTAAGTYELEAADAYPSALAAAGGYTYYLTPSHPVYGAALWRTAGAVGGAELVKDLPEAAGDPPSALAYAGGKLYFAAPIPGGGTEPWVSDGTAAGTVPLGDLTPGTASSGTKFFTAITPTAGGPERVVFVAGNAIWSTDGTPAGTTSARPVGTPIAGFDAQQYLISAGHLAFYSDGSLLWRTDGTTAGTYQVVRHVYDYSGQKSMAFTGALAVVVGDTLLFGYGGSTRGTGRELRAVYLTPPPPPTGLAAAPPAAPDAGAPAADTPQQVRLTWADHSQTETGFVVERSTSRDFADPTVFFVDADVTEYVDTTAVVGDRYFYRVRTVNAGGVSPASNAVSTGAPEVTAATFDRDRGARRVLLTVTGDVTGSLDAADFVLKNGAGETVTPVAVSGAYDPATDTTTVTLVLSAELPDARYTLTVGSAGVASSIGVALDGDASGAAGGDFSFAFAHLTGDVDGNGAVSLNDLVVLANHYGTAGAQTW
ncbi:MAG TPA: hypothetical protein VEA69_17540, partial [Tepidisphaeraceae bacterium]|nr:hypothetical protein [Tepidisphaeraceae bacterium]